MPLADLRCIRAQIVTDVSLARFEAFGRGSAKTTRLTPCWVFPDLAMSRRVCGEGGNDLAVRLCCVNHSQVSIVLDGETVAMVRSQMRRVHDAIETGVFARPVIGRECLNFDLLFAQPAHK